MSDTCSSSILRHAAKPCAECPWRRDQPVGRFPASRYRALADTSAGPTGSAPPEAPMFACHKTAEGREIACAGWLAAEGHGHVGVRLAIAFGRLDASALQPAAGWPALFDSYADLAVANGVDPDDPRLRRAGSSGDGARWWLGS